MKNTARRAAPFAGAPAREVELFLADVRRALNLVYFDRFEITTTDATATTICTASPPSSCTWNIAVTVTAKQTNGAGESAVYRRVSAVTRVGSAAPTVMGTDTIGTDREDVGGWNITIAASGNDIILQVTGAAGDTVNWTAVVQVQETR